MVGMRELFLPLRFHLNLTHCEQMYSQPINLKMVPYPLARSLKWGYLEPIMKHTLTVAQGQEQFSTLCRKQKTCAITRNGKIVAYVVPQKWMATLLGHLESMETMANSEAMTVAQRGKGKKTVAQS